ncbi:uncharacterized protein LOC141655342 [Silene latifolia]|uniref:uncharacterized protein LOC141655342 n=1 Tax=Silene latifolia TaxID=37657 RepID=UPI003D783CA2
MLKLVGDYQNAFIPGRNIGDNILIANELFRKISSSKSSKCGKMAFNADMMYIYCFLSGLDQWVSPTAEMGKYLGLPTDIGISGHGKSKKDIFNFLIDNIKKRTSSWNGLLLSSAGRLSLISSILSSLSTYFLSVFKMSVSVTNKINSLLSQFWWRGSKTSTGISWCSKLFSSQPKGLGGLGIRNTRCFNQALLAKVGWNILRNPSSLLSHTIGVELGIDWFNCANRVHDVRSNVSWICKGILWGAEIFVKHIGWIVGSESNLNVWTNPWVNGWTPIPKHYDLIHVDPSLHSLRVKDLISANNSWNVDMLCDKQCVESLEHLFRDCEYTSRLWSGNILDINASSGSNIIGLLVTGKCLVMSLCLLYGSLRLYEHDLSLTIAAEKERTDNRNKLTSTLISDDGDANLQALQHGNAFSLIGPVLCEVHFLIYTDSAWRSDLAAGLGWAVKKSNDIGAVIYTNMRPYCYAQTAAQAEALSILEALQWDRKSNLLHVCIYSDCLQVIAQILDFIPVNIDTKVIVSDILSVGCYFHCLSFCYVPRNCNKMAHRLATRAIRM